MSAGVLGRRPSSSRTRSRSRWRTRTPSGRPRWPTSPGCWRRSRCSRSALSVVVSAAMARRFTTPLRRLTEASRGLAEGDLSRRVPPSQVRAGSSELAELAVQFNAMADRLEESVEIIRRDRDRSRDFLADVSHELRTPLAALRTFNELLREGAGRRPGRARRVPRVERPADRAARLAGPEPARAVEARFRASSCSTCGPDDLRAAVESAVEQSASAAARARRHARRCDLPAARSGSATTRSGSARSWPTSWPTPSSSRRAAARSRSTWRPRPTARGST